MSCLQSIYLKYLVKPSINSNLGFKKTSELSELCRETNEPVFITINGYGEMAIMSMDTYEKTMLINDIFRKVEEAE